MLFLISLLAKPKSEFAQFRAKQGITLFICSFICYFVAIFTGFFPLIGPFFAIIGYLGVTVFSLFCVISGLVNVSKGVMKPLPAVGQFAEKIKF